MRAALLATLSVALAACSHGAPGATPAASVAAKAGPAADAGVPLDYPVARKVDVVDDYHGTKVADPYRWLEDPSSPGYREWIDAENTLTERVLSTIPDRAAIKERLTALWDYERYEVPIREANRVFYERNSGLQPQPVLYVVDLPRFEPRVLIDPNTLIEDGTMALTGTVPSRDGKLLAYGVAEAGSDWEEWRVREVDTGHERPDRLKWVKFSEASWTPDGKGFYYSRFDEPGPDQLRDLNYFQKLYYHGLGTPQSADRLVYERKDQKEWTFGATVSDDGRWLVIHVYQGTDRRNRIYVQDLSGKGSKVRRLVDVLEAKYAFVGSQGPVLWFHTNVDAPRGKVISIDMRAPDRAHWRTLIPESEARLEKASAVGRRLVLNYLQDAHSVVRIHGLDGKPQQTLLLPAIGTAKGFEGRLTDEETYFSFETLSLIHI